MKQTQTKMFDFSDVGLDFCAGSKSLFPDRLKKILSIGYNAQTVASVAVDGNQVTLTYGVSHGYVANRVLKITSGALSTINSGEFVIDSVTENTLKMTIDNAPTSVTSGFTTIIASLGWELVYELTNIHIYKFKHFDDTDLYLRLCFQDQAARRNMISPCVGRTYDPLTGYITDQLSFAGTRSISTPASMKWEFSYSANATYNSYTYAQGLSTFGNALVIGSKYHLIFASNTSPNAYTGCINAVLPAACHNYEALNYPVVMGGGYGNERGIGQVYNGSYGYAAVGGIRVNFSPTFNDSMFFSTPAASTSGASFLPETLDNFQTTAAQPIPIFEYTTRQHIGYMAGGLYLCSYASTNTPSTNILVTPQKTYDVDLNNLCVLHYVSSGNSLNSSAFLIAPVEEIKIGY